MMVKETALDFSEIRISLRQRSIFEVFDLSLLLFKRTFQQLWPLYFMVFVFWSGIVFATTYVGFAKANDTKIFIFLILAASYLFLRFFLQKYIVVFLGRWIFTESVPFVSVMSDLSRVGWFKIFFRGLSRFLIWLSGFFLLLPFWYVLIYRIFDYEHWLLERISSKQLRARRRTLRSGRVMGFRIIHLCFQLVFLGITWFAMKTVLETIHHLPLDLMVQPAVFFSILFLYEPFFLISRFVLYLQTRIDLEAWDVSILMNQSIQKSKLRKVSRRTMSVVIAVLGVVSAFCLRPAELSANPALRNCTSAMKDQPYFKCDPTSYRIYTDTEIEEVIPKAELQQRPAERESAQETATPTSSFALYLITFALLIAIVFLAWRQYRKNKAISDLPDKASADATEFQPKTKSDRLLLIQRALQENDITTALGYTYLFLIEEYLIRSDDAGFRSIKALTPSELRQRIRSAGNESSQKLVSVFDLIQLYELVFYANTSVDSNQIIATIDALIGGAIRTLPTGANSKVRHT